MWWYPCGTRGVSESDSASHPRRLTQSKGTGQTTEKSQGNRSRLRPIKWAALESAVPVKEGMRGGPWKSSPGDRKAEKKLAATRIRDTAQERREEGWGKKGAPGRRITSETSCDKGNRKKQTIGEEHGNLKGVLGESGGGGGGGGGPKVLLGNY